MIASWLKDGVMEDLTSKIKAAHINLSQYLPSLVSLHEFGGKIYGLPKDWDTIAYFYNADYFTKHHITVPSSLSWNAGNGGSWVHFLRELTIDTSGHNALSPAFNPNSVATYALDSPNEMQWGFEPYLAENGTHLITKPYAKTVSFGTGTGVQTFQFLTNLMYKWHVAIPGSALGADAAANNNEDQQLFAKGKVAMIRNGDWITSGLPSEVKFKIGVLPFPSGPGGDWTVLNGLIDSINTHSPHQQAAWELEQWLASPQSERILGAGGYVWPGIGSLDPLFLHYWQSKGINMEPFLTEAQLERHVLAGHARHEPGPARHGQPARPRLPIRKERASGGQRGCQTGQRRPGHERVTASPPWTGPQTEAPAGGHAIALPHS